MPDTIPVAETPAQAPAEDSAGSALESVFDLHYIPTSACAAFDFTGKSWFSVPAATLAGMRQAGTPQSVADAIVSDNCWELIIESYAERHSEDYALHNTLSDSVAVFACGAAPVEIRISGRLLTADHADHRLTFLSRYLDGMRARRNPDPGRQLSFFLKGVTFSLIIKSLSFAHAAGEETYTRTAIDGWAFHYPVAASIGGYYGATAPTPAGKEEAEGAPGFGRNGESSVPGAEQQPVPKARGKTGDDEVRLLAV